MQIQDHQLIWGGGGSGRADVSYLVSSEVVHGARWRGEMVQLRRYKSRYRGERIGTKTAPKALGNDKNDRQPRQTPADLVSHMGGGEDAASGRPIISPLMRRWVGACHCDPASLSSCPVFCSVFLSGSSGRREPEESGEAAAGGTAGIGGAAAGVCGFNSPAECFRSYPPLCKIQ
eukprot:gene13902-biopygen9603